MFGAISTVVALGCVGIGHGLRNHLVKNIRSIGPGLVVKSGSIPGAFRSSLIYTPYGMVPTFYKESDTSIYDITTKRDKYCVEHYYGKLGNVKNLYITDSYASDNYSTLKTCITLHILFVFYTGACLFGYAAYLHYWRDILKK